MSKASPGFVNYLNAVTFACLSLALSTSVHAANLLQIFDGCELIKTDWADGDSFQVELPDGSKKVFRLYYVDCIETGISTTSDKRRLREQSRYFGLDDFKLAHDFGIQAKTFTQEQLSKPFTLHTAFADARGRSGKPRYYCFITTSKGIDLAQLLVSKGYARAYGVGREMPDGTSRDEHESLLSDIELAAAIRREGAWSISNPDALVKMRKEERDEMRGLEAIDDAFKVKPPEEPVEVNTASLEQLVSTGLRESLADGVIRNRPFLKVDDIIRVKGIGDKTLHSVEKYLWVDETLLIKDLNEAPLEELVDIGLTKGIAERVIKNRPYRKLEELLEVKGIGPATYDKISPYLEVTLPASSVAE